MPVGQTGPSHTAQHYFRVRGKPTTQVQSFPVPSRCRFFWEPWNILTAFPNFAVRHLYLNHYYPFASNSTIGRRLPFCQTCSNKDVAGLLTCLHLLCYCSSSHLHFRVLGSRLGGRRAGEREGGVGRAWAAGSDGEVSGRRMGQVRWPQKSSSASWCALLGPGRGRLQMRKLNYDLNSWILVLSLAWSTLPKFWTQYVSQSFKSQLFPRADFSVSCHRVICEDGWGKEKGFLRGFILTAVGISPFQR